MATDPDHVEPLHHSGTNGPSTKVVVDEIPQRTTATPPTRPGISSMAKDVLADKSTEVEQVSGDDLHRAAPVEVSAPRIEVSTT